MGFSVVIPARYASTRLPGKPLRDIAGKPMIRHVYERALQSGADEIVIATDDERIRRVAESFGVRVCMTAAHHPSGTDRLAEVARMRDYGGDQIIVNLQGDEPLMPPALIRQVAGNLHTNPQASVATLCERIHTAGELFDPHLVKVVMDSQGYALYFSRAAIPWDRDAFAATTGELPARSEHYRHIGLYAYRAGFLQEYVKWTPCVLEQTESLEQLRVMWHGYKIHVAEAVEPPGMGVDTEADLARVCRQLEGPIRNRVD
ncbi:MAG: 3-deoxy-manno-octulosonate cytidylyltransferase [Pseudomonadota bacterium]